MDSKSARQIAILFAVLGIVAGIIGVAVLNSVTLGITLGLSLLALELETGRKNQIRAHFSEAGHPVAGDAKYGRGRRGDTLCLHAWKLAFRHPRTGERLSFASPPPPWTAYCVRYWTPRPAGSPRSCSIPVTAVTTPGPGPPRDGRKKS